MDKEEIKSIERTAQSALEKLQDTDASFLYIGDDANCFTVGGDPEQLTAQLVIAMIRYPVVNEIVSNSVKMYKDCSPEVFNEIRNFKMDHQNEVNSGNKTKN